MADLLDIAPSTAIESVKISGGRSIDVRGLHADAIAGLAARFPGMVMLLGGVDALPRLIGQCAPAIGAIIAAGSGHPGDEKAEKIANELLIEDQIKLISAIYRLTFPNGLAALIESVNGLQVGAADESKKTIRVRLKTSPSASPPSSDADSRPTMQ